MKLLSILLLTLSIFVVSFYTMIYGWGVEPARMDVIIGSYVWTIIMQIVISALGQD